MEDHVMIVVYIPRSALFCSLWLCGANKATTLKDLTIGLVKLYKGETLELLRLHLKNYES